MRTLTRTVLVQAGRSTVLLTALYVALICGMVSTPLLHKGAPLEAVLSSLRHQVVFALPFALPLGLVGAILAVIGRLRESGELIALRSTGISALQVARGLVPLTLAVAVIVGFTYHHLMPATMLRLRQDKITLARQGVATAVARKERIIDDSRNQASLAAADATGQQLGHLFGLQYDDDGGLIVAYAPTARWAYDERLYLETHDLRLLRLEPSTTDAPPALARITAVTVPRSAQPVPIDDDTDYSGKPDTMDLAALAEAEVAAKAVVARFHEAGHSARRQVRHLRRIQLERHYRWFTPCAVIAHAVVALAVALCLPFSNQALHALLALLQLFALSLPGPALVSGAGGSIAFHPAWVLWPPLAVALLVGSWVVWKRR